MGPVQGAPGNGYHDEVVDGMPQRVLSGVVVQGEADLHIAIVIDGGHVDGDDVRGVGQGSARKGQEDQGSFRGVVDARVRLGHVPSHVLHAHVDQVIALDGWDLPWEGGREVLGIDLVEPVDAAHPHSLWRAGILVADLHDHGWDGRVWGSSIDEHRQCGRCGVEGDIAGNR